MTKKTSSVLGLCDEWGRECETVNIPSLFAFPAHQHLTVEGGRGGFWVLYPPAPSTNGKHIPLGRQAREN